MSTIDCKRCHGDGYIGCQCSIDDDPSTQTLPPSVDAINTDASLCLQNEDLSTQPPTSTGTGEGAIPEKDQDLGTLIVNVAKTARAELSCRHALDEVSRDSSKRDEYEDMWLDKVAQCKEAREAIQAHLAAKVEEERQWWIEQCGNAVHASEPLDAFYNSPRSHTPIPQEELCSACTLPMSLRETLDEEEHPTGSTEWVCDGPNDRTDKQGCWSVQEEEHSPSRPAGGEAHG